MADSLISWHTRRRETRAVPGRKQCDLFIINEAWHARARSSPESWANSESERHLGLCVVICECMYCVCVLDEWFARALFVLRSSLGANEKFGRFRRQRALGDADADCSRVLGWIPLALLFPGLYCLRCRCAQGLHRWTWWIGSALVCWWLEWVLNLGCGVCLGLVSRLHLSL